MEWAGNNKLRTFLSQVETLFSIVEDHTTLNQINFRLRAYATKWLLTLHARLVTLKLARDLSVKQNSQEVKIACKQGNAWVASSQRLRWASLDWNKRFLTKAETKQRKISKRSKEHIVWLTLANQNLSIFAVLSNTGLIHRAIKQDGFVGEDFKKLPSKIVQRDWPTAQVFLSLITRPLTKLPIAPT